MYLLNENLTSEKYIEILEEALSELTEISLKKDCLQIDNAIVQ